MADEPQNTTGGESNGMTALVSVAVGVAVTLVLGSTFGTSENLVAVVRIGPIRNADPVVHALTATLGWFMSVALGIASATILHDGLANRKRGR